MPTGQFSHASWLGVVFLPLSHWEHFSEPPLLADPEAQGVQASSPAPENFPDGHVLQLEDPGLECWPASQTEQDVAPEEE